MCETMPDDPPDLGVVVPEEVFDRLLQTQDLAELKAILTALQLSARASGRPVPAATLLGPDAARTISGPHNPEGAERRAQRAVDRAVANGALLRITVGTSAGPEVFLVPATDRTRRLADRVHAADSGAVEEMGLPSHIGVSVHRPNVFAFYEQHLGPLTPLIADQLRDAERSYPRLWIEEAIVAAADSNTRSWRYIETILTRWEETGAPDR